MIKETPEGFNDKVSPPPSIFNLLLKNGMITDINRIHNIKAWQNRADDRPPMP